MSLLRRLQQLFGFESRLDKRRRLPRRAPLLLESLEDRNLLSANLVVSMSADPPPGGCIAGESITYVINVENMGSSAASGVALTDTLPSETFQSQAQTAGNAAFTLGNGASSIDDTISSLGSFSSATFSVTALVSSSVADGTNLTDTATASATGVTSASSSASASIGVSASLSVSAVAPPVVVDGDEIVWAVRVTSEGPSDAPSVSLTDALPTGVTYSSQVQTGGPAFSLSHSGSSISDTISSLAAGASATFDFVGTVNSGVSNGTTLSDTPTASYTLGSSTTSASSTVSTTAYSNGPVSITNPGAQTSVEGSGPSLWISATDYVSGATLTYSAQGLPPGLSINYSTGAISGTVAAGDAAGGPYDVMVTAGDGTYSADVTFTWNITSPISITNPGAQSGSEGSSVSLSISASDSVSGATLSYTGAGLPDGLKVNPSTGAITGTLAVGNAAAGPYDVTLTAGDGTYSSSVTIPWTVTAPLTLSPIADQTSTEGASVSLSVSHSYSGSGTLAYTAEGLPPGLTISTSTGTISGTVAAGDADLGPYSVTVSAGDGTSGASQSLTWNVNSPITITTPADQTNTEGDSVSLSVSASDSASGSTLTYGAVGLPVGLSINYSTGAISGTVSAGDAADGPYTVALLAEDGTYRHTTQFTWNVNSAVTLTPPADQSNNEGDSVSVAVSASYAGGALTYSAARLPSGLSINSSTGLISGTASDGGWWEPTVTASSGSASASATFGWDVSGPITIADPGPQQYNAGDAVSLPISASDTASGTLSYSASGLPTGLSINSSTGIISGTISSSLAVGVYTGTVTATDGTNTGVDSFAWTISAAGAVVVTDPGTQTTTEGSSVSLTVGKSYSGSGTLAYAADGLPPGLKINPSTGAVTGTVAAGDSLFGPYDVTVTITDGTATDSQYFVWNVSSPISLTNPGTQSSTEGGSVSLSISASYSGGSLTYSADGLPAGLKINPSTGAITGTVAAGAAADGPYGVTLQAAYGSYAAQQTFTWNVSSPITLTQPSDQTSNEGSSVSLSLSASDSISGSTLKYSALGLPPGLKINASSGAITGTAAVGDAAGGPYSVAVIAEDGTYSSLQTFNWTINSPVTITTPADQTSTEGSSVSLTISASETGATLYYAAEGLPPGLVINPTTGAISGTVTAGDAANGPYDVTVNANGGTYSASTTFTWNVNSPVSINVPDDQTNNQGDSVTLSISVTNTAGGTLSWSASGLPNGLSINSSTGVISGTVSYGGSWEPAVTATNGTYSDTESFGWTVNSFVSIADPGDQLNQVGDAVSLTVTAADEASGTLSYSASGLPTGLSINSSTGAITGTVGTGASTSAPYTPTVTVSDGTNEAVDTFTWTINPSGSVSIPYVASQTNTEGDEVALPVAATNTAGQTLFFTASGLPAGLYINPVTGLIFGTVSAGDSAGSPYSVTVTARAGSDVASQTFSWTVDAAGAVTLPNPGDQFGAEGATVNVAHSGTDSSGGTLYYAAFGLPPGLSIAPSDGAISGTLAAGDAADGPYVVTVIANDGTYSASQTFAWNVSAPITITEQNDQTNNEGDASLSISASDTSGTLTYAAEGLPPGLKINPSSGAITGTVAVQDAADGPYSVTVVAVDGTYSNSTTFNWNVNSPVTISVPDAQSNSDGDGVSLTVSASDTASGTLTYSAQGLPPGLAVNASTGAITGTVALGDSGIGTFEPTLLVTDGTYTGYASFEWDVAGAISITDPGGQANVIGDAVTLPVAATDTGSGTLSYAATELPAGLAINPSTGEITGTIASSASSVGDYTTTVTVSDGTNTASDTFDWTIAAASGTLTLATPSNQTTAEGASASLSLSTSYSGTGTLRYFAEGLPPGLKINPSTGAITGTVAVGDSAYGPYTVAVIATDGTNYAEETLTWGTGGAVTITPAADQSNTEGDTVSLAVSASDSVSGSTLKYSALGLPPGLSINAGTGAITGTVALDAAAAGPYRVVVTAADGTYSASQSLTWTVNDPVTIAAVPNQTDDEGDPTLPISFAKPSGSSVTVTAQGLPPGLGISITGPTTAVISGDIAPGSAFFGTYTVTVTVNDGTNSASTTFTWTVGDPISIAGVGLQTAIAGTSRSLQVNASDAAGRSMSFLGLNLPFGLAINAATGLISGTIGIAVPAVGTFVSTIEVTDGIFTAFQTIDWLSFGCGLVTFADLPGQDANLAVTAENGKYEATYDGDNAKIIGVQADQGNVIAATEATVSKQGFLFKTVVDGREVPLKGVYVAYEGDNVQNVKWIQFMRLAVIADGVVGWVHLPWELDNFVTIQQPTPEFPFKSVKTSKSADPVYYVDTLSPTEPYYTSPDKGGFHGAGGVGKDGAQTVSWLWDAPTVVKLIAEQAWAARKSYEAKPMFQDSYDLSYRVEAFMDDYAVLDGRVIARVYWGYMVGYRTTLDDQFQDKLAIDTTFAMGVFAMDQATPNAAEMKALRSQYGQNESFIEG